MNTSLVVPAPTGCITAYGVREGQVYRLFHDRPEDAVEISKGPLAILTFLGFTTEDTGGNCEASRLDIGTDGMHVLVAEDGREPIDAWGDYETAVYDEDGGENDFAQFWCADSLDERDDFVTSMVEYANRAERAKAGA